MLRRQPLRSQLRRVAVTAGVNPCHSTSALLGQHRRIHEQPFLELPADASRGEAYEAARDALLQLNIMTRRGIEPDAIMYTSLIHTMGRAGLEWQAYKLFSRMVEANVRPLPETYVALHSATSRQRTRLRADIQAKIEETVATFPSELAEAELARQREENRACVVRFEEYMRGELPPPTTTTTTAPPLADKAVGASTHVSAQAGPVADAYATSTPAAAAAPSAAPAPVATMRIRNPMDAWSTAQHAEELRGQPQRMAAGTAAEDLRTALDSLHTEELRIFLSANRQLRHGTRLQLVQRVLDTVGEAAIRAMLDRRRHYFRSVESLLAADLEVVRRSAPAGGARQDETPTGEPDGTMTAAEKAATSPEVLLTPWGLLRKPLRYRPDRTMAAHRSYQTAVGEAEADTDARAGRLDCVRLTAPELLLVRRRAETEALDELPDSLLRRYAFQFRLRWRRRVPLSLIRAVHWHATTFLATQTHDGAAAAAAPDPDALLQTPPPTPAIRLKREGEGVAQTLENLEAFRIIAQRTNNLQVVDDAEINLHLRRTRAEALRKERRADEALRREEHLLAAASLATAARSYTPAPDAAAASEGRVLGWREDGRAAMPEGIGGGGGGRGRAGGNKGDEAMNGERVAGAQTGARASAPADELPPWALTDGQDGFNLSTGRFGDPDVGRYQELSDSTIRVLPSREAQKQWSVDRTLLPRDLKDVVDRTELEQLRYRDAVESEYSRRRQYAKYRRWDGMIQRAEQRRRAEREAAESPTVDGGGEAARPMRPLPAKKRLAQLLRRGVERQKVSEAAREQYNRSL